MTNKKFESRIKHLKYQVLKRVAESAFRGDLAESVLDIPKEIIPGKKPTMRCCVYKERAILGERVKLAMGGDKLNPNVVEVISIACDECMQAGYHVTDNCRGCIAHHCEDACAKEAITFDDHLKANIDTTKCIQCGRCAMVCPYDAIINHRRPCEKACEVHAIKMSDDNCAEINNDDCIRCGACVNACPFGAVMDKSYIVDVVNLIKETEADNSKRLVACFAPSIAVQYPNATVNQVVSGIIKLGFTDVVEAALGADRVAVTESIELVEKGTLTSSCCPAFVELVRRKFPLLKDFVSTTPSPMVMAAMAVKEQYPGAKVVFIGPCIAKKEEIKQPWVAPFVDSVLTFEELDALLDAKEIDITTIEETVQVDDATYYGRNFGKSGGVANAVTRALRENYEGMDDVFDLRPIVCNGAKECIQALKKAEGGKIDGNFIEGMACSGGCVNGPVSLRHLGSAAGFVLEKHSSQVKDKKITKLVEDGWKSLHNCDKIKKDN